jgi:phosphoglycolate phosphatase
MPDLRFPRAILFDWDNTLVDTWPCIGKATNLTREAMGLAPWSEAEIREKVAGSLRDTFPAIYGARWEEARDIYYRAFEATHLEMLRAIPGAQTLLAGAANAGIHLGVVSNKTGEYLRAEAAHLGWTKYFGRLVGAQDATRDKPAPEPVHLALRDSRIPAGRHVWFVGDAPIDVECGRGAGCTTVVIGPRPEAVDDSHADHYVNDCSALASFISATLKG